MKLFLAWIFLGAFSVAISLTAMVVISSVVRAWLP